MRAHTVLARASHEANRFFCISSFCSSLAARTKRASVRTPMQPDQLRLSVDRQLTRPLLSTGHRRGGSRPARKSRLRNGCERSSKAQKPKPRACDRLYFLCTVKHFSRALNLRSSSRQRTNRRKNCFQSFRSSGRRAERETCALEAFRA